MQRTAGIRLWAVAPSAEPGDCASVDLWGGELLIAVPLRSVLSPAVIIFNDMFARFDIRTIDITRPVTLAWFEPVPLS